MISWVDEFQHSIKSWEAEDRLDLYFYRPMGFLFAKTGAALHASPTQLTLASMATGIAAGAEFARAGLFHWCLASVLLVVSGVLDSADGQLARISGRSTTAGLVLDGLCDTIVFFCVYLGCLASLPAAWGAWIWPIALAAGACHAVQSATFDYYLREYLYYVSPGHPEAYRNPSVAEAEAHIRSGGKERWIWQARALWLRQQRILCTRDHHFGRAVAHAMGREDHEFRAVYRNHQLGCIRAWRLLGSNCHTLGIIFFAYLGRFDLYLILVNLIALNTWMLASWWRQQTSDRRMIADLQRRMVN